MTGQAIADLLKIGREVRIIEFLGIITNDLDQHLSQVNFLGRREHVGVAAGTDRGDGARS